MQLLLDWQHSKYHFFGPLTSSDSASNNQCQCLSRQHKILKSNVDLKHYFIVVVSKSCVTQVQVQQIFSNSSLLLPNSMKASSDMLFSRTWTCNRIFLCKNYSQTLAPLGCMLFFKRKAGLMPNKIVKWWIKTWPVQGETLKLWHCSK